MARRRKKKLYLYPGATLANIVVGSYVYNVPRKLGTMTTNYRNEVTKYLRDAERQANASRKLALWYDALYEGIDEIGRAYEAIKNNYRAKLKAVKGLAVPVPPPPAPAPAPVAPAIPAPTV